MNQSTNYQTTISNLNLIQTKLYIALKEILCQKKSSQVNFQWKDDLELVKDLGLSSLDLAQLIAVMEMELEMDPFVKGVSIAEVRTLNDLYKAYMNNSNG